MADEISFLHIGKTGGSFFEQFASQNPTLSDRIIIHPHSATVADLPTNAPFIVSVRCPVNRYLSAFNSRKRKGRPLYNRPWTTLEWIFFTLFPSAEELACALDDRNWFWRKLARAAMQSIRHVCTFQADWMLNKGELVMPTYLLRQEHLNDDIKELMNKLNIVDYSLPTDRVHVSKTKEILSDRAIENLKKYYLSDIALYQMLEEVFYSE